MDPESIRSMNIPPPVLKAIWAADKYLTVLHSTTGRLSVGRSPEDTWEILEYYDEFKDRTQEAVEYLKENP